MPFDRVLAGLQDIGGLLVKRGSALGPLVPALLLSPVFLGAAWLFRSVFVIRGYPILTALLVLASLGVVFSYLRHYAQFAKTDPDRLQSEEYRYETARMQMIAAKELQHPVPAEALSLEEPRKNPAALGSPSEEDNPSVSTDSDEEKTK